MILYGIISLPLQYRTVSRGSSFRTVPIPTITASDFSAGHHSVEAFKAGFEEAGGKVIKEVYPKLGTMDFASFLTSIDIKGAEAVYAWYAGTDAVRFVQQYQEFGLKTKIPLIGGGTTTDEHVLPSMGDEALGVITPLHYSEALDNPANKKFVKAYGHNGYFRSLKEIVHFYNTRDVLPKCAQGDPDEKIKCWPEPELNMNVNTDEVGKLGLDEGEEEAIVAFLKTLSDGYGYGQPLHHPLADARTIADLEQFSWPDPAWMDVSGIRADALGWGGRYAILGGDGPYPRKPSPEGLLALVQMSGARADTTLMVGDSRIDLETAVNAGCPVCLATYGFGWTQFPKDRLTGGEWTIADPHELVRLIEALAATIKQFHACGFVHRDFKAPSGETVTPHRYIPHAEKRIYLNVRSVTSLMPCRLRTSRKSSNPIT
jgi:hypothetical protein